MHGCHAQSPYYRLYKLDRQPKAEDAAGMLQYATSRMHPPNLVLSTTYHVILYAWKQYGYAVQDLVSFI